MDENIKIENAIKIHIEEQQPQTQPIKKQDYYKMGCNCDDENKENDCFHCERFLFPIGCMVGVEDED